MNREPKLLTYLFDFISLCCPHGCCGGDGCSGGDDGGDDDGGDDGGCSYAHGLNRQMQSEL